MDHFGMAAQKVGGRIVIQNESIDERLNLRDQYTQQVFQPGHNMPTMSLEEFADIEMEDAMRRQA